MSVPFMHGPTSTTVHNSHCYAVESPLYKPYASCHACLNFSHLHFRSPMIALWLQPEYIRVSEIYIYMHQFKFYDIWPQTDIHAHVSCNTVPLVAGLLRLGPIRFTEKLSVDYHHKGHTALSHKTPLLQQFDSE